MTTNKKMPTRGGNHLAGNTNGEIIADRFEQLKDQLAMGGYRLYRTDPRDGCVMLMAERIGMCQLYDSFEEIATLAAVIESKLRGA